MNIDDIRSISWRFSEYLKQNNLKAMYFIGTKAVVLAELYNAYPEPLSYPAIAEMHNLHRSNVCRAVNNLENEQFINRNTSTIELSDDGLALCEYVFSTD